MNQDQIDSLTRTALKIVGGILAAHGGQQMATLINMPDVVQLVSGIVITAIGMYASHSTHSSETQPAKSLSNETQPVTQPQPPK